MPVLFLLILIPLLGLGSLCTANRIHLSMASQINATVGQSVLLPCFISPPPPPLKDTRVYWQTLQDSKGNSSVLHFINMGVEKLQHQAPQYQNRTALDLSQVAAGHLSLELRSVTEADNQTTICCHYSTATRVPMEVNRITLMVLQEPDVESTAPDSQSFPCWATALLIGALLLVLLACGVVVLYKVLQRRTGHMTVTKASGKANHELEAGECQELTVIGKANGE